MDLNSKPETLYDVCELTAQAIEGSPANYYQGRWATEAKGLMEVYNPEVAKEACGTAFCRAGWMCAITDKINPQEQETWEMDDKIAGHATRMLIRAGIPEIDISWLFSGAAIDFEQQEKVFGRKFLREGESLPSPQIGTEAYAKAGAEGMRNFMAKWEEQLKSVKVKDL